MKSLREYVCNVCNNKYISRQSLCNHNRKFHINNLLDFSNSVVPRVVLGVVQSNLLGFDSRIFKEKEIVPDILSLKNIVETKKIYECKLCNKKFNDRSNKWKHEKICNKNIQINNNNTIINNDNRQINTNNNINIKLIINKIGSEDINELTENEIKQILLKNGEAITKYIELINFNKELPNNHSFCTTNLKSKYLDVFNTNTKTIDKDRKKYFFDKLLKNAVNKIKKLFEIYKSEEYIINNHDKVKQMLKSSIELGEKFFNDKILKELFNKIELLSYNKKNLIKNTWDGNNNLNYKLIRKIKKLILSIISYKINDNKILEINTKLINSLIKKIKLIIYYYQ